MKDPLGIATNFSVKFKVFDTLYHAELSKNNTTTKKRRGEKKTPSQNRRPPIGSVVCRKVSQSMEILSNQMLKKILSCSFFLLFFLLSTLCISLFFSPTPLKPTP
jgi:hypothetical protein